MTDESGMLNDTYLKKYSDQLKGLNLQQAQFTLSTTALSSAQKEQVLVEAGLIASKDKIKASLVASTLAQSIDNEEKRKAILKSAGLYDEEKKELLLNNSCTEAKLRETLSRQLNNTEKEEEIINTLKLNSGMTKELTFTEMLSLSVEKLGYRLGITNAQMAGFKLGVGIFAAVAAAGTAAFALYKNYQRQMDEAVKSASEAGSEIDETTKSIDEQITKVKELREQLADSSITEEEAKSIKQELLGIQDSLVEKYGKEAESINLVNGNLKQQIQLLEGLSDAELDDYFKDEENRKGVKESTKRMTEKKTYNLGNISSDRKSYDIVSDIVKDFKDEGLELVGGSGGMSASTFTIKINANASDAKSTISDLMDKLEDAEKDADEETAAQIDSLLDSISKSYTKASDIVEENEPNYLRELMKKMRKFSDKSNKVDTQELKNAKQNLKDEYQKISDWGLDDYANQIKNNTIQTKFGNVDMDKRTIIHWSDELKQTYADALASWDYNPEVGSIDTVFGGSERFGEDLNGEGWEVAFTPILPDGTFLSKNTVETYINAILQKAYADDGKVTDEELKKIDAQGLKIGNTFVQGIYAGIDDSLDYDNNGNWAEVVGRLMHFSGDDGAIQLAKKEIQKYKDSNVDDNPYDIYKRYAKSIDEYNEALSSGEGIEKARGNYENLSKSVDNVLKKHSEFKPLFEQLDDELDESSAKVQKFYDDFDHNSYFQSLSNNIARLGLTEEDVRAFNPDDGVIQKGEKFFQKLLEAAEEYGVGIDELIEKLKEYGAIQDDVFKNSEDKSYADRLSEIQNLSKGLDQLDQIYADVLDGGDFDFSSIFGNEDFTNTFSEYTDEYDNFIKTISNSPTDINACQQAFNDLATAYIYNSNALKSVTDETKESTITMLEQMGVQNASIIVEKQLVANKVLSKLATMEATEATREEIKRLLEEQNAINGTTLTLEDLYAIKCNVNNIKIDTASDIEQIINLANAAGESVTKLEQLRRVKSTMEANGAGGVDSNGKRVTDIDEKMAKRTYDKMQDGSFWDADLNWANLNASDYITPVNYTGGSASNKVRDKKDEKGKDNTKEEQVKEQTTQTFDFIETRIDRLESKISKFQKRAEDAKRSFSSRIYNYKKEISTLFSELKTQNKAYDRYMQKANSIGLSEEWKKKVRNGAISIKDVKDDVLKEQIESYQTWYEKAKKAKDATDDLTRSIQDEYEALAKLNSEYAENKIDKYSSSIDLLEAKKENYTKYTSKNNMLSKESSYLNKELSAYQKAYRDDKTGLNSATKSINKTKTTKANKKVLKEIKSCIKSKKEISSGILDRALSIDSNLYNQCVKYNAYLVAYETDKATYDLKKQENESKKADLAQEKMDNIDTYYSNRRQGYEQRAQELNNAIDINEAKGYQISTKYYSRLISEEKKNNASLVEERKKLVKSLADSLKNGSVKSGSEEWYEMSKQIDDVTNAIDESTKSLVEYNNQLRQIKWDNFDYLEERIKTVTSEVDFMINELSREDLTSDDIGDFTDRGKAVAYLHASNYTSYIQQAKDYEKEVSKIEKELAKDPYNKTLISRKEELIKSYEDSISAAQDEKYAIIDLYTQGYEALKNRISDLISEYEKLMDAEKNAYDWQNTISEKTKQIADLRKQLIAYSGDVSEETRSKIQSLNVSLKDAEKDLRESEYDKLISDTKDMLSDLQDNFDDVIQDVIDSLSENFKELLDSISKTSNSAVATIKGEMNGIGYTPTDEFKEILNGTNVVTTTQSLIDTIKDFQTKMTEYANLLANSTSTTTGGQSAKDKIRSDGEATLSKAISESNSELSYFKTTKNNAKISRDEAKTNRDLLKKQYENYIKTHSKNSSKAKELKSKYDTANNKYNKLNRVYNVQNDIYKNMKKQNDALNYLKSHLNTTDSSRDKLSDLNKALYDKYGQRVLSETEMKELAKIVGVKFDNKNKTGNLYKKLKDLGIPGFKVGSRNIPKDMVALLGEEGNELHFSKEQGVLREVGQGDKVFTNEQAQNLWKLSQLTPVDWSKNLKLNSLNIPQVDRTTNTIVEVGDIVMQGVNDVETFGKQLREEICKGGKTTKCITEAISSTQLGKGIGKAKLYK